MNEYSVTINGVDYTKYAVYPLKWGNLLDERLDEAYVTLKFVPKSLQDGAFRPLSLAKIVISNTPDTNQEGEQDEVFGIDQNLNQITHRLTQTTNKRFLVARDTVYNNPIGGNFDTHELYIIEETKFLEAFICDTLTFRNALLNRFGQSYQAVYVDDYQNIAPYDRRSQPVPTTPSTGLQNPIYASSAFVAPSINTAAASLLTYLQQNNTNVYKVEVVPLVNEPSGVPVDEYETKLTVTNGDKTSSTTTFSDTITIDNPAPLITVSYVIGILLTLNDGTTRYYVYQFHYNLNSVTNRKPLKKWTITDVVTRCCELAEPLFGTETPRFAMDGVSYDATTGDINAYTANSQAAKYDKVIAPEFSMTKSTLREQLQQVGGFIHAEPRLVDGKIYFDKYGGTEMSRISQKQFISVTQTQSIDEFCTELDSTADNLVNRLNYAQGVVIEPYVDGARSVRTEQTNIRIDETNGIVETALPISDVVKLECAVPTNAAGDTYSDFRDITSFIYEDSDYNNLSSYDVNVNGSKAYALYWERNARNIKGLFFKNENAINAVFSNYAIYNIMLACGVKMNTGTNKASNYPRIKFRISYIPTYTARVRTNKSLIINGKPRTLAYNQGANSVETQYYGENLKGVVARLGNIERTLTYKLTWLTDIPKAGQLFDEHNYISAVSVEMYATYFKVTIGLSRDFNRLSEYIGISSEYRQYQVSETAVYNRESVLEEYAVITTDASKTSDSTRMYHGISYLAETFVPSDKSINKLLTYALVKTTDKSKNTTLAQVLLPLIASAFGNTISFRFAFKDNYSAGQKSVKTIKDGNTVYYAEYVPYTDYYGKFYYLNFKLSTTGTFDAFDIPEANYNAIVPAPIGGTNIRYRKDNAEIPAVNYQLSFVTDDDTIIIGSALARSSVLINNITQIPAAPHIYGFNKRLPLFDEQIDVTDAIDLGVLELNEGNGLYDTAISFNPKTTAQAIEAWAIITPSDTQSDEVSDENGNVITQTVQNGYRLILGQNKHYDAGASITLPKIIFKRKIYE
jgi:hypothetical protein